MPEAARTHLTYRYERWRAVSSGILEAAGATFLLLFAVRWYEAGAFAKALVAASGSTGLMLAPWIVSRVEAAGWPVSLAASRLAMIGAVAFAIMALAPVQAVFVIGSLVAMTMSSIAIPLLTRRGTMNTFKLGDSVEVVKNVFDYNGELVREGVSGSIVTLYHHDGCAVAADEQISEGYAFIGTGDYMGDIDLRWLRRHD
jgi:hypothetical protein